MLLLPLVCLIFISVSLVGYLSYRNGQESVNEVALQLRSEINARIEDRLFDFLNIPHQIIRANSTSIGRGLLDSSDQEALLKYFWEQIQVFDSVTSIYYGNTDGGLANAGREGADGNLYKIYTDDFVKGAFNKYNTDIMGNITDLVQVVPGFNATERQWFRRAVARGDNTWSEVYTLFTGNDLSISASCPVYNEEGKLIGVAAADLFLSHFSSFLSDLAIGKTGQSYIIDHDGFLIASSSRQPYPFTDSSSKANRIRATESTIPLIAASAIELGGENGNLLDINKSLDFDFNIEGERQFGFVTPYCDRFGLSWYIITVIPEIDFMAQINSNNRTTVLLMLSTLMISILLSIYITRRVINPVSKLRDSAEILARGDWDQYEDQPSNIREISSLSRSFNQMAEQLKRLVTGLKKEVDEQIRLRLELTEKTEQLEGFFSVNLDLLCIADMEGYFIRTNKAWEEILGYSSGELNGKKFLDFIHPDDIQTTLDAISNLGKNEKIFNFINRYQTKDGTYRFIEWRSYPKDGLIYAAARDITDKIKIQNELQEQKEQFELAIKGSTDGIFDMDLTKNSLFLSAKLKEQLGYQDSELPNDFLSFDKMLHPDDKNRIYTDIEDFLTGKTLIYDNVFRMLHKDGTIRWIRARGEALKSADGTIYRIAGSHTDITENKQYEEALKLSEEKYRFITENTSDVIWVFNLNSNKFTYISPSIYQLRGFTPEEAMGQSLEESLTPESYQTVLEVINDNLSALRNNPDQLSGFITELQQPRKDGKIIWIEVSTKYRENEKNEVEVIGVSRNIDERKTIEQEIRYLSFHDQLTGLYNRRFYEEELNRLNTERNHPISLLMADLNGLKITNDAFGHIEGDNLLIDFAEILRNECRADDIISRVGGDEFVILLPKTDSTSANSIKKRIKKSIADKKPRKIKLSVSFGLKTKKSLKEPFNDIYKQAEDSMYRDKIKESGTYKSKVIKLLTASLYEKFPSEEDHSKNVSIICREFGKTLGMDESAVKELEIAGLMHNIGWIGIESKLDDPGERNNLNCIVNKKPNRHPEIGYKLLQSISEFSDIASYILAHHERYDGRGYPSGLKAENIPLQARIIRIASDYDWMSRVGKMGNKEIKEIIAGNGGVIYDPYLVKIFVTSKIDQL